MKNYRRIGLVVLGLLLLLALRPAWSSLQDEWVNTSTFFDVDTHGWPFENDTYEFQLLAEGTFLEISPEWSVCGGMSLSAKKRFLTGIPIEDLSDNVKQELIANQWETLGSPRLDNGQKFLWWMARPDFPHKLDKHTIGTETKEEWPRVKTSIDMGFPVVLGLVLVGPTWHGLPVNLVDVGENHQVLAIGYSYKADSVRIIVYDSNYPRKIVKITVNFASLYPLDATYSEPLAPGKRVRGFFVIDDRPRCILCDCPLFSCLTAPSSSPLGYRYLGDTLWKVQPKPAPAFSVPMGYVVR